MITKTTIVNHLTEHQALNDIFELLGTTNIPIPRIYLEYMDKSIYGGIIQYPGKINMLKQELYPHANLILDCLTVNPNNRPTVYEILDKYFNK